MYGIEAAEIYDLLHRARGKDFEAEADVVADLAGPGVRALLDVACGTGAHLEVFAKRYEYVEGIDLSEAMLTAARQNVPDVKLSQGDMRDFDLGRTFDVITCLFCSIAYLGSADELTKALRCFAKHLAPGGVVIVEPWWFPERFTPGHVAGDVVKDGDRTVARVSHASSVPAGSRMDVHYVVAQEKAGIRHFAERHEYTLFSKDDYEAAFAAAGMAVRHIEGVQSGRGLFAGVAAT